MKLKEYDVDVEKIEACKDNCPECYHIVISHNRLCECVKEMCRMLIDLKNLYDITEEIREEQKKKS